MKFLFPEIRTEIMKTLYTLSEPVKNKKRYRINCTFSSEEFMLMEKEAKNSGLKKSAFLKAMALAAIKGESFLSPLSEDHLRKMTCELRRIGTNINQIAKTSNTFHGLTQPEIKKTVNQVIEMEGLINHFVRNPGRHDYKVT